MLVLYLVDVPDICYFFLLGGGESGVRGAKRGADDFLLKIPGGEGSPGRVGEGLGGCLRGIWGGGGLNIFFGLGSCRAGMAWKTAQSRKWKKNGNRNGKRPRAGQGQKWQKKAKKW